MRILVACEESQAVCIAFREAGHEAYSCDTQYCSGGHPEWHILGDAKEALYATKWDLVIAHPPCTFISNSGVRWLYQKDGRQYTPRWLALIDAIDFFNIFLDFAKETGIPTVIENPIPHKHAVDGFPNHPGIGRYCQTIQPYEYGHTASKRTCLWLLNGVPNLLPTKLIPKELRTNEIWKCPPGPDRQKIRSKTFPGIAKAMAEQWGNLKT